jgi:hypothetical protein
MLHKNTLSGSYDEKKTGEEMDMDNNNKGKITICLLLILTSLSGLAFAGGLESGLSRTGVLVAGGALVACVFSFALWLNETKTVSLTRLNPKVVPIREPILVSRSRAIIVTSEDSIRRVAKNRGLEMLVYSGEGEERIYYVVGDKYTYVYTRKKSPSAEEDNSLPNKDTV